MRVTNNLAKLHQHNEDFGKAKEIRTQLEETLKETNLEPAALTRYATLNPCLTLVIVLQIWYPWASLRIAQVTKRMA